MEQDKSINIIISTNKPIRRNFKNNRFKLEINKIEQSRSNKNNINHKSDE